VRGNEDRPDLCPTCYQAPIISCSRCGSLAPGRRNSAGRGPRCFRCILEDRLTTDLKGQDGRVLTELQPICAALTCDDQVQAQAAVFNLSGSPGYRLLRAIAAGRAALTHATLDEQLGLYSIEHLRCLLVAGGALPERDEHLARLQHYVSETTTSCTVPEDQKLAAAFARWHVLAKLRRRTLGHVTANAAGRARSEIRGAVRLLEFLRKRSRTLSCCRQQDLDEWFSGRSPGQDGRGFLVWAARQQLLPDLEIRSMSRRLPNRFSSDEERWLLARRLLHDSQGFDLADRVAGCLVLLYAQPLARIVELKVEHVQASDDRTVTLLLGQTRIKIPTPLDRMLVRLPVALPAGAAGRLHSQTWLFPGRRANTHLHAQSLARRCGHRGSGRADRLHRCGIDPRGCRNTALLQLAAELPAAVLADLLGMHVVTADGWVKAAAGNWSTYAAAHAEPVH